MLNNTYIFKTETLVKALNHIDVFLTRMLKFNEKNKNYKSTTSINRTNMGWEVKIIITSEQKNLKTITKTIITSRVL